MTRSELRRVIARHERVTARAERKLAQHHPRTALQAGADSRSGIRFQRGVVFYASSGGVQEYSPSGQLVQTVPGTSGAGPICFNPNGTRLAVPGVGLFDNSGNLLPSNWASVGGLHCAADGFGHVYVSEGLSSTSAKSIVKYDMLGNPISTFTVSQVEQDGLAIDVAPDECTIYYGSWGVSGAAGGIDRFDGCTMTQDSRFNGDGFVDDLRVLPNWQVLVTDDSYARNDTSGQTYSPFGGPLSEHSDSLRYMTLDPDGRSFWVCCTFLFSDVPRTLKILRFDMDSGQQLASWAPTNPGLDYIAAYAPPLFGDADVEGTVDSNPPGTAEAFATQGGYSGQLTRLHLWVDSSSTASNAVLGIYSDHNGHPGPLQTQGTITNLRPGSWNYVDVPSTPVTKGQRYWIAVLAPSGGGTLSIRDTTGGGASQTSGPHKLTTLPAQWPQGTGSASAPLSAYGS